MGDPGNSDDLGASMGWLPPAPPAPPAPSASTPPAPPLTPPEPSSEPKKSRSRGAQVLTWLGIGFICAGLLFMLAIAVNFESAVETTITESVEATEDESGFVSVFALLGSAFGLIAAAIFIGGGAIVIGGVLLIVALIVRTEPRRSRCPIPQPRPWPRPDA